MKKTKIYTLILATSTLLFFDSCRKEFLDVNTDPNNPKDVTPELLLPAATAHHCFILGGQYQIIGGFWSQYLTQGPTGNQYNNYDQYQIPNTTFDRQWVELYSSNLEDYKIIAEKGVSENKQNYAAIGYIMQAYIFQLLTDLHGNIPYSQALQGVSNISPAFDKQETIYHNLAQMVDKGISLIDYDAAAIIPGDDDFIYHGDMFLWEEFANTLKLRIYLRMSEADPTAAMDGITQMMANNPFFLEGGEDGYMEFLSGVGFQNPIYAEVQSLGNQNLLASNTAINFFISNADPRIDVFYMPASTGPNSGAQTGINQGDGKTPNFPSDAAPDDFSQPGEAVAGAAAPVILMSAAESYFLQAEAVARGWMAGDAQQLYESGITASFDLWGVTLDPAFLTQPGIAYPVGAPVADQVKAIVTQKWAAMCNNQSIEAWNEWRRTGYPDFFVVSTTSLIGNQFPVRLPYPNSEIQTNPNTPGQPLATDKVWWDVN